MNIILVILFLIILLCLYYYLQLNVIKTLPPLPEQISSILDSAYSSIIKLFPPKSN